MYAEQNIDAVIIQSIFSFIRLTFHQLESIVTGNGNQRANIIFKFNFKCLKI